MATNLTLGFNGTNGTNATAAPAPPAMGTPPGQTLAVKIALVVIGVTTLVGNGTVIYLVAMRHRLRTKTNFMVMSLAISDFLVGIAIIPSFLACMYVECDNLLSKLFYDAFLFISVCNLCCITFDRFLSVTKPLRYHAKMTRRKVLWLVIVSWIVPGIVSIVPVAWLYTDTSQERVAVDNKIFYTIQVVVFMLTPCVIMLVAYAVIFNIAWKQTRHIRRVLSSLSLSQTNAAASTTREAKATLKVFGTVVVVFVFCWSLSAFRTIVTNYKLVDRLPIDLIMTSRLLLVANSAINPIIYSLWKKDFKKEIRRLFRLNTHMVRPSFSFRSSQADVSGSHAGYNSTGRRRTSNIDVQPVQDIDLTQMKKAEKPVNGMVNKDGMAKEEDIVVNEEGVVNGGVLRDVAEKDEGETKSAETEQPEQLTPSTLQDGTVNVACKVDGLV